MNFLLSGYYGFGNAGDEAVLTAMLEALGARSPGARFTVLSGAPANTVACHNATQHPVEAVPRQHPRALAQAVRACDVFISGGGSLLQDVTSLRNVVYYTSLMRFAHLSRKPVVIYAQGVGPLRRAISQKLARAAVQSARVVTVRDDESKNLLRRIGVRRAVEVTADPVWALTPQPQSDDGGDSSTRKKPEERVWGLSLRPWPGYEYDFRRSPMIADGLREARKTGGARLRFVPMQHPADRAILDPLGERLCEAGDEIVDTAALPARAVMAACARCDVMIAMRLHALIFAAAQSVPCVAINYDPKVAALARLIGAPLLPDLSGDAMTALPAAVAAARPLDAARRADLQRAARRNAELAAGAAR